VKRQRLFLIVGPTAVGKSAVATVLAQCLGAEIVSCDAMMVYREPRIIVNKPTELDRAGIIHHMLDLVSVRERYDAAQFCTQVRSLVDVRSPQVPLVMCGGSGMYVRMLMDGNFADDATDEIRSSVAAIYADAGIAGLSEALRKDDPVGFAVVDTTNPRRMIRALEVVRSTGQSIAAKKQETFGGLSEFFDCRLICLTAPREELYARINARASAMFEEGVVEEIKRLLALGLSETAEKILGISIIKDHLDGRLTAAQAKELLAQKTRNYAKRQLTWFRGEPRTQWLDRSGKSDAAVAEMILKM